MDRRRRRPDDRRPRPRPKEITPRPGESRDPSFSLRDVDRWVPAFAGMPMGACAKLFTRRRPNNSLPRKRGWGGVGLATLLRPAEPLDHAAPQPAVSLPCTAISC